jgi:hypothetical protein
MRALDDLANELCLYCLRANGEVAIEDPQGSLYDTIREVEMNYRQHRYDLFTANRSSAADSTVNTAHALSMLKQQDRDLLSLHLGESLTCLEIAERQGQTREVTLIQLVRTYSHLRLHLGGNHLWSLYDRD